jgi:hypothetical protein
VPHGKSNNDIILDLSSGLAHFLVTTDIFPSALGISSAYESKHSYRNRASYCMLKYTYLSLGTFTNRGPLILTSVGISGSIACRSFTAWNFLHALGLLTKSIIPVDCLEPLVCCTSTLFSGAILRSHSRVVCNKFPTSIH